ncbi:hypothetical protein [Bradyrhizobium sp.]|uniref:hypothetical protein n=1 Tax=Bradyrhizobium sp. TaxID=376 RepID=UPI00403822D7
MKHVLLALMVVPVSAGSVLAQAPPSPTTPAQRTAPPAPDRPANCAPMDKDAHPGVAPEGQTTGQAREPLSDKLARSDGVLCPPAGIDPEMRAPTPDAGKTPVIPPPGSPGGDPSVRPK